MDSGVPKKVQTNEEIIEELTKDLHKSCVYDKNTSEIGPAGNEKSEDKEDDKSTNNENDQEEDDEFYIDDIALKDREIDLTSDERQELKKASDDLKNKGNNLFKDGDYKSAASLYTEGLRTCPLSFDKERAILYANRAAAKAKFVAKKISAIEDCTKAVELDPNYVKAYLRRAHFYEQDDRLDDALADYNKVLSFDPNHVESICAVKKLEPIINERNEKLKTEMLGKLKELGNMILKPFGLSTNNFQVQKDESSGGYSMKFNQNVT